jgi:hypothetical protein
MCLTGGFALSLLLEPSLLAPVLSQPSLPFAITPRLRRSIDASARDFEVARERVAAGCRVLGLRFTHDLLCPGERFETLRRELGLGFEAIEIDSGPGNAHGISPMAHSVLAHDLVDEPGHPTHAALERVITFLRKRLGQY